MFATEENRVSFAEASIRCITASETEGRSSALLTSIDTDVEEDFITSLILQEKDRKCIFISYLTTVIDGDET